MRNGCSITNLMQENVCTADLTQDPVMISSIVDKLDLHCAFARMIYPEIKELSDDEIKQNHKSKRQAAKAPRFALAYGGTAFTIHKNEGIPLEEATKIEKAYKELHPGIISFGENKLLEAINTGYIQYWGGFRLHLPNFSEFKKTHEWIKSRRTYWWTWYKEGKIEYKCKKKYEKENKEKQIKNFPPYKIKSQVSFDLYRLNVKKVSDYFKLKSNYLRLCLNAPQDGVHNYN